MRKQIVLCEMGIIIVTLGRGLLGIERSGFCLTPGAGVHGEDGYARTRSNRNDVGHTRFEIPTHTTMATTWLWMRRLPKACSPYFSCRGRVVFSTRVAHDELSSAARLIGISSLAPIICARPSRGRQHNAQDACEVLATSFHYRAACCVAFEVHLIRSTPTLVPMGRGAGAKLCRTA
jgi:hypothetical protein